VLVYIVALVLVVCLCPSSVRLVATFPGIVLFPSLCSVICSIKRIIISDKHEDKIIKCKTSLVQTIKNFPAEIHQLYLKGQAKFHPKVTKC
jgi:hypothetical protein